MRTALTIFLLAGVAHAEVRIVERDLSFDTPAEAAQNVLDGETVEFSAMTYRQGQLAVWKRDRLTLKGVGGIATILGQGDSAQNKALWVIAGDSYTIENIAFVNARSTHGNGAGIRLEGRGALISKCEFRDNQNGILGGHSEGDFTIHSSVFSNNGAGDGYTHSLYVGKANSLEVIDSSFENVAVGHHIKSRAAHTLIKGNRISDGPTRFFSYAIDLPNGGHAQIEENFVRQSVRTHNRTLIAYGLEGLRHSDNRLALIHNLLVSDRKDVKFVNARGVDVRWVNNLKRSG